MAKIVAAGFWLNYPRGTGKLLDVRKQAALSTLVEVEKKSQSECLHILEKEISAKALQSLLNQTNRNFQ